MSEENVCTTVSNEKMNQNIIDEEEEKDKKEDKENKEDKNIKEDKNNKNLSVDNTVKPTRISVTEPRKDRRIPNWLPEKDVEIVEPVNKPPHLRSKVNLCANMFYDIYT